jgi:ribokinase
MTVGKDGAFFGMNNEREFVTGRNVNVVDTTAAGDTFLGYYISGRMRGMEPKAAMEKASIAASVTVSRPGAMDSIPLYSELQGL